MGKLLVRVGYIIIKVNIIYIDVDMEIVFIFWSGWFLDELLRRWSFFLINFMINVKVIFFVKVMIILRLC